jgi:hypothetical protein
MRLEDVCAELTLTCHVGEQVLNELMFANLTTEQITEELFEQNTSKLEYKIGVSLHCLQRDYGYSIEVDKIDINYPMATITFDVELDENDYDTLQECKEMFVSSFTRTLTHEPYQIYTVYGRRNDLTMMLVSVEVVGVHI